MAISSGLMALGFNYAHLSKETYLINDSALLQVFGLGFLAIPVISLVGIAIASSLKS